MEKDIIKIEEIEDLIIEIRGKKVILDRDIARLYGVETKRINEAVKNNIRRFPKGYILELSEIEKREVVENFVHLTQLKFSPMKTKAFTEKGVYMLATILTSQKAIDTTIQIIETFSKIKELSQNVNELIRINKSDKQKQNNLLEKTGSLFSEILDNNLTLKDSETTIELNLAVLKLKHVARKEKE